MNNIWFIADTHFDDERILKYENRPFQDVNEMNQCIIGNWNRLVKEDDLVYLIGDIGNEAYISSLNGKKYLIKGNHDTKSNELYRQAGFVEVYDKPIILDNFWILSHEPMYVNVNMPYANIFGHVHNCAIYKTFSKQHYCVTVERTGYGPVGFDEIKEKVK